jgi:hypothetical protein
MISRTLLSAAIVVLLSACSLEVEDTDGGPGETDADADTDTDADADSDADADTAGDCPEHIADSCAEEIEPLPMLLEASELGEGVRFASLGKFSLLAVRDDGESETVILYATEDPDLTPFFTPEFCGTAELTADPGVEIRALGSVNHGWWYGWRPQIALVCLDDECTLYGAKVAAGETTTLEPLENGTVPCGPEIEGLIQEHPSHPICVYGRGVCCFHGPEWNVEIEPEADHPLLYDIVPMHNYYLAVGQQGRFVRFGDWPQSDSWSEGLPDYLAIAVGFSEYAIATAGGGLMINGYDSMLCPVAEEDIIGLGFHGDHFDGGLFGVTASGRVFRGFGSISKTSGLCFTGQQVEAPLAVRNQYCGIWENRLMLGETALLGTDGCMGNYY